MYYSNSWKERNIMDNFKKNNPCICYICGKQITDEKELTVDHIVPKSRGGKTIEGNMAICCLDCNRDKADMTINEYYHYKELKDKIIKESVSTTYLNTMVSAYENIIKDYMEIIKLLKEKQKEKQEIEDIIMKSVCNASEGYNLYRDLKNILNSLKDIETKRKELEPLQKYARENKNNLIKINQNIIDTKIRELRNSLNISRLGQVINE